MNLLFHKYKPLSWIPNKAGLSIFVITKFDEEHRGTVRKASSGLYCLDLPDGVLWSDLTGWRE